MPSSQFNRLTTCLAQTAQLLPSSCALCGESDENILCDACRSNHFCNQQMRCSICALPIFAPSATDTESPPLCGECIATPPSFDRTIVACNYVAPADQLVLALKFAHQLMLAPLLSNLLRDAVLGNVNQTLPDLLTAVPLGQKRLQERGFNQAVEIGRPLSKQLGIRFQANLLERTRETQQQSSLHPDARHKNMRRAFVPNERFLEEIKGRHIGVVDDVITTGTTMNEIAITLKRFGAIRVSNYVFARTLPH
ncbi:ComF family protein [Undibacterium sp. Jales W-56]|uniref:phosphoribosyltransferase family protein n=1 Tax=Undibacterium sp. Jales W-56 TaxID=2897325 RepID=UPI0021CEB50D|nr:phosphoribosyltransferase family protein [Undibacterium sp. Jales W-56]MCU6435031.1 ComF family protein [Undibacterium sp. Jales W-56]